MARAEGVVFAFRPAQETADAVPAAQRVELIPPPGKDLVGLGLVAHVPDQCVPRRIEDPMQSDRQIHHAQG